jgi:hypothetical protein
MRYKIKLTFKRGNAMVKKILILALCIIAAIVFLMQMLHLNAWWMICLYWLVLTIKNAMDVTDTNVGNKR